MRVLYVIDGLGTGGAERSLAEMLPRVTEAGIEPTVAVLHRRGEGVESDVLRRAFDVRFLAGTNVVSRVRELRRIARERRPDLIHTTLFAASQVGRLAAVGADVPVLTSLVSTPYAPARLLDPRVGRLSLRVVRTVDGWSARHLTTHFHAITEAVKRAAVASLRIRADLVTVVERGRDPGRLGTPSPQRRLAARAAIGLRNDDEVVVSLGRQEFPKGHRFLLEAVERLAPTRPRLVLLMVGRDGHASPEIGRIARRPGVSDVVRFVGHREDAPDLLAAADVFAFPSLIEGLGGALIEAMALGLPIVASDLEAIREVVEEGGNARLVPAGSPSGLAAAIAGLLEDRATAAAFGARSRAIFEDRFTVERSTGRMVELYRRLAASSEAERRTAVSA
jgi:glycosyltransferase involved in cell wall biosynthesis